MGVNHLVDECLQLLRALEEELPGKPDLEALHSVTGVYAELKRYRDKIDRFPSLVRKFCEFLHAARRPKAELVSFLAFLAQGPGVFCSGENESFLEKRRRIAGIASQAGFEPSPLFHLLSLAKLKGILDKNDVLVEDYKTLIADYLTPG